MADEQSGRDRDRRDDAARDEREGGSKGRRGPDDRSPPDMRRRVEDSGVTAWMDGGTREERQETRSPAHGPTKRDARKDGRARSEPPAE